VTASSPDVDGLPAFRSGSRRLFAAGAVVVGLALGWATNGQLALLSALTIILAAVNGYAKAYSP
jgi:hypothetical protein